MLNWQLRLLSLILGIVEITSHLNLGISINCNLNVCRVKSSRSLKVMELRSKVTVPSATSTSPQHGMELSATAEPASSPGPPILSPQVTASVAMDARRFGDSRFRADGNSRYTHKFEDPALLSLGHTVTIVATTVHE